MDSKNLNINGKKVTREVVIGASQILNDYTTPGVNSSSHVYFGGLTNNIGL